MKKTGKLCLLLSVLAVLTAGIFLAKNITASTVSKTEAAVEEKEAIVLSFLPENTDAFSCTYAGETLSFVKLDAGWALAGEEAFPLCQSSIEKMLSCLSGISAEKAIPSPDELSAYGLEDPECSVTVGEKTLSFGDKQDMDGYTYITPGDGTVYLVDSSVPSVFRLTKADLIENETVPSMPDISALHVETRDGEYEILHLPDSDIAYSNSYQYFLRAGENNVPLDTELTEALFNNIRNLTFSLCENWNADDAQMHAFGLDDPEVRITVDYTAAEKTDTGMADSDGQPIYDTVEIPCEFVLYLSGDYACLGGSRMVYTVGNSLADTFLYTTAADLMPDEVLALDYSDVTAVTVQLDGAQYRLEKTARAATDTDGETDILLSWQTDGSAIDPDSFLQALRDMLSYGYAGEYAAGGVEELSVSFERSNPSHPLTTLSFCRYSSENCLTLLDGNPTVFVRRSDVSSLADTFRNIIAEAGDSAYGEELSDAAKTE